MLTKGIEVVVDGLEDNPHCFHGPALLFRKSVGKVKEYYACSACRDHKDCNFYLPKNDKNFKTSDFWKSQQKEAVIAINNSKPYEIYSNVVLSLKKQSENKDKNKKNSNKTMDCDIVSKNYTNSLFSYCNTCNCLFKNDNKDHLKCTVTSNLTLYQLTHPTEILIPKTETKTHAQYFFLKSSVKEIVLLLTRLKVSKVICIGVPRIHEYILNECSGKIWSLLLDLDKNYYNFYNKDQFIWYNMFNDYIFESEQLQNLHKFLKSDELVVLIDPPFGGRVEPLARTLNILNKNYLEINNKKGGFQLKTFWFFPYFMEQYIVESLPDFKLFDYKVNYENHKSFTDTGNRKRKFGSPVRIFTNIPLASLDLKGIPGYKFCTSCGFWVSNENRHCEECNACTSKDGRTYVHCFKCSRCVKPSYEHCETCQRCCLSNHVCGEFQPNPNCFHCGEEGHKKKECPKANERKRQRHFDGKKNSKKRRKVGSLVKSKVKE